MYLLVLWSVGRRAPRRQMRCNRDAWEELRSSAVAQLPLMGGTRALCGPESWLTFTAGRIHVFIEPPSFVQS